MLTPLDFYRTHVVSPVYPESNEICIPTEARRKLDKVGIGNHTYFVLMHGRFREVIRYDHVTNFRDAPHKGTISIQRDVQGTGRKTFPIGSCMAYVWIEEAIREIDEQIKEQTDEVSQ